MEVSIGNIQVNWGFPIAGWFTNGRSPKWLVYYGRSENNMGEYWG
jgi:hypothetical protein